jgi:hypothetical protein
VSLERETYRGSAEAIEGPGEVRVCPDQICIYITQEKTGIRCLVYAALTSPSSLETEELCC